MIGIAYTPQDNPEAREEIPVDIELLWVGEVKLLEKVMGQTIAEFGELIVRGSFSHMMAYVWIWRRRTNRELRLDDMDDLIRMSELQPFDTDADEAAEGDEAPKGVDQPMVEPKAKQKA